MLAYAMPDRNPVTALQYSIRALVQRYRMPNPNLEISVEPPYFVGRVVGFSGWVDDFEHSIAAVQFSLDGGVHWTEYATPGNLGRPRRALEVHVHTAEGGPLFIERARSKRHWRNQHPGFRIRVPSLRKRHSNML